MLIMKLPLFLVLVVMVTVDHSNACSCRPANTIHDKFCKSDFMVLVKVLDNGRVYGMKRVYRINLITTYKSNVYGRVNTRKLYTATSSATCGVILQRGYYYVLTGDYRMFRTVRKMYTGLCDTRQRFHYNPERVYKPHKCY